MMMSIEITLILFNIIIMTIQNKKQTYTFSLSLVFFVSFSSSFIS